MDIKTQGTAHSTESLWSYTLSFSVNNLNIK